MPGLSWLRWLGAGWSLCNLSVRIPPAPSSPHGFQEEATSLGLSLLAIPFLLIHCSFSIPAPLLSLQPMPFVPGRWESSGGNNIGKGGMGSDHAGREEWDQRITFPIPSQRSFPVPSPLARYSLASRSGMGGLGLWLGCGGAGAAPPNLAKGFVDPVWDPSRSLVTSREWEFSRTSGTGLAGHKVVPIPLTQ